MTCCRAATASPATTPATKADRQKARDHGSRAALNGRGRRARGASRARRRGRPRNWRSRRDRRGRGRERRRRRRRCSVSRRLADEACGRRRSWSIIDRLLAAPPAALWFATGDADRHDGRSPGSRVAASAPPSQAFAQWPMARASPVTVAGAAADLGERPHRIPSSPPCGGPSRSVICARHARRQTARRRRPWRKSRKRTPRRHREKMEKRKAVQDAEVAGKTHRAKGPADGPYRRRQGQVDGGLRPRAAGARPWLEGRRRAVRQGRLAQRRARDAGRSSEGPFSWHTLGEGFTWETQDRARDEAAARRAWDKACELMDDPEIRLLVLDELNIALRYEHLPLAEVIETLAGAARRSPCRRHRPQRQAGADRRRPISSPR